MNFATNGAAMLANTIQIGNVGTVTNVFGRLTASIMNTSTPLSTENSTVVPTTAWVTSNFAKTSQAINTSEISGTNWNVVNLNVSNLNVSILKTVTPLRTENSAVVPTTAWVNSHFGELVGGNTWSDLNTFGNLSTSQVLPAGDSSQSVAPTSWITSNFGAKVGGNTWTGTNAFGTLNTTYSPSVGENTTNVPPCSWVTSNFAVKAGGNSWTGPNVFSALASNQSLGSDESSNSAATTSWVTTNFPKVSSSLTWSGNHTWTGNNLFSFLNTNQTIDATDSSTKVVNTSWVNAYFPRLSSANTWSNLNVFTGLQTTAVLPASESSNMVPNTRWVSDNFAKIGSTGSGTSYPFVFKENLLSTENSSVLATTAWVTTNFAGIGSGGGSSTSLNVSASSLYVSRNASFDCPISTTYLPSSIGRGQIGHIVYGTHTIFAPALFTNYDITGYVNVSCATLSLYKGVWQVMMHIKLYANSITLYPTIGLVRNTSTPSNTNNIGSRSNGINTLTQTVPLGTAQLFYTDVFIENSQADYYFLLNSNGGQIYFLESTSTRLDLNVKAVRIA